MTEKDESDSIHRPALGIGAKIFLVLLIVIMLTIIGILIYYVYRYRKNYNNCMTSYLAAPCNLPT